MKIVKTFLICGLVQIGLFGAMSANAQWLDDLIPDKETRDAGRVFPNRWSGSLPRPILFIHGIASDGYSTWGLEKPMCRKIDKIEWYKSSYEEYVYDLYRRKRFVTREGYKYVAYCASGAQIGGNLGYIEAKEVARGIATDLEISPENYFSLTAQAKVPGKIINDIDSNGIRKLGLSELTASYEGFTESYKPDSTPAYLAHRYGLDTRYSQDFPNARINHNGLEFYNINKLDVTGNYPLSTDTTSYIHPQRQAKDLREKIIRVLDEYYSDWRRNPDAMIDLVTHSQGGIVTRSMLQQEPGSGDLSNPLNHINHIVTVNTPHLGTAFVHTERGVSSIMRLRDYVLNDVENRDSVKILGVGSMDFLPAAALAPIHQLNENSQHLRYACNLHNPAWEPSSSDVTNPLKIESPERFDMCVKNVPNIWGSDMLKAKVEAACKSKLEAMVDAWYSGNDTDCSSYMADLQKAGYPKAPNGRLIPMTAMYGRVNPEKFVHFLEIAKDKGLEQCDSLSAKLTLGDCEYKVRRLFNGAINIAKNGLTTEWLPNSDFVVDVSSQIGLGLFEEGKHPFRKVEIRPLNPDVGVYHMDMSALEKIVGEKIPGGAWHGDAIFDVLNNPPK